MSEYGFCECGCGERTNLAPITNRKYGHVKGEPYRFIRGHHRRKGTVDYVEEDRGHLTACWIWQRLVEHDGYGRVGRHRAHRYYYERAVGPIPEGMQLDHLCRVPLCVNPAHLEPVTGTENVRRGRATKLTAEAVREIRASDATRRELAEQFGVTVMAIRDVVTGRNWADV